MVIAHLGAGGTQRVAATVANALVERGIEVHLIKVFSEPCDAYLLDPRIHCHSLGAPLSIGNRRWNHTGLVASWAKPLAEAASMPIFVRRSLSVLGFGLELRRRTRALRRAFRTIAPDAVLSFLTQTNIITLLAAWGLSMHVVISERNDPIRQQPHFRVALLRKLLYRRSDVVTANSAGAVESLASIVPRRKLALLPNPLGISDTGDPVSFSGPTFLTVTRLVPQKAIDVLLKAAALAFVKLPEWRLAIVGDGPLREEMHFLAGDLGIASRVDWLGYQNDPAPYLKAAKFFVLTSRFEGSPNALLEAMACGLSSVVSNASPGPLELIGDDAGLVVPVEDVEATAAAIVSLANDENLRTRLGEAAVKRTEMYQLNQAIRVWLDLLRVA
jgi:glycosyltransferase involved in cell wall biosynthesis